MITEFSLLVTRTAMPHVTVEVEVIPFPFWSHASGFASSATHVTQS